MGRRCFEAGQPDERLAGLVHDVPRKHGVATTWVLYKVTTELTESDYGARR